MPRSLASRRIYLGTKRLSPFDALVWESFLRFSLQALEIDADLIIDDRAAMPNEGSDFVFLSGSEVLSRKLLLHFDRIYIAPHVLPSTVDAFLYYQLCNRSSFFTELQQEAKSILSGNTVEAVEKYRKGLQRSKRQVALITSVFNGDRFLEGFLANSLALERYSDCEHFLIRPGSLGDEHERLLRHACDFSNAVYLSLSTDPGLYEVWNLGAQLATAPYLTNANLDDRRAPVQLKRVIQVLDSNHDVSVASCALRVSETPNLNWEDSTHCEVWFKDKPQGIYQATDLIVQTEHGMRPNNVPHCMPLWRRKLHLDYGYFDETRYGPSADWEFWLRAGRHGALFYFTPEQLGLYLKDGNSYWRRNEKINEFERAIMQSCQSLIDPAVERPLALSIDSALQMLRGVLCYETVAQLLRTAIDVRVKGSKTSEELLRKISQVYLFGIDVNSIADGADLLPESEGRAFKMLVDLVHNMVWGDGYSGNTVRTMVFAGLDAFEIDGDRRGLLLWAWIARQIGSKGLEKLILQELHRTDRRWFWENIQAVYRFSVELMELSAIVGDVNVVGKTNERLNLAFFPDYSESNAYQRLLYEASISSGATVNGVESLSNLVSLQPVSGCRNVFHLHWLNAIFRGVTEEKYTERAAYFIRLLKDLKARGFEIAWTIHNHLEHETVNRNHELMFRRNLYELVDRIYLHHPLATEELDWLPSTEKLRITEHGAYPRLSEKLPDRERLRSRIGLKSGDLLLAHIGLMRDYKGLDETLPILAKCLKSEPRLHLLLAGQIISDKIKGLLSELPASQVWIEDHYVSGVEVESIMHAADIGFLSYRSILTSGSLFHWFSCGVPVIAPALGTIPAYVVTGWNGLTYKSAEELSQRVKQCFNASSASIAAAGKNARQTAKSLRCYFS